MGSNSPRGRYDFENIPRLNALLDHGLLLGLSDDDHTQYLLADGSRALAGNWDLGGNDLTNGGSGRFDGGVGIGIAADPDSISISALDNDSTDPILGFYLGALLKWVVGLDDSDGDKFKIGQGGLGAFDAFVIDTSGNFDFKTGNFANVGTIAGGAYNGVTLASGGQVEISANAGANFWSSEGDNFIIGQADGFKLYGRADGAARRILTVTGADITLDAATQTGWGTSLTHVTSNGTDHSLLGATAGTVSASLAVIVDASKDIDFDGGDITTIGTGRFDGGIGIGAATAATGRLNIITTESLPTVAAIWARIDNTWNITAPITRGVNFLASWKPADQDVADKTGGSVFGAFGTAKLDTGSMTSGRNITLTNAYGVWGNVNCTKGGSHTGNATITNAYSLYASGHIETTSGVITNAIGLGIAEQTVGENNWAIYSVGGDSSHAGNFRIGSNVAPTVALDVTGAALISSTLGVTGVATLGDSSQMATSAAPTADADIANKKYVDDSVSRIKTGTYTGDNQATQAITGVGFTPKHLWIDERETVNTNPINSWYTTTEIIDDAGTGGCVFVQAGSHEFRVATIASLDADGFTVTNAADAPNGNGIVYNYICMG